MQNRKHIPHLPEAEALIDACQAAMAADASPADILSTAQICARNALGAAQRGISHRDELRAVASTAATSIEMISVGLLRGPCAGLPVDLVRGHTLALLISAIRTALPPPGAAPSETIADFSHITPSKKAS